MNKYIIATLALSMVTLAACTPKAQSNTTPTDDDQGTTPVEQTTTAPQSTTAASSMGDSSASASPAVKAAENSSEVKSFELEAGSFYYKPNEIKVKKGDKVKVTIKSVDMMHDFNIDDMNVHIPVTKSGSSNSVEFTADKVGTFEFYCAVGQHRQKGQVGKITVE